MKAIYCLSAIAFTIIACSSNNNVNTEPDADSAEMEKSMLMDKIQKLYPNAVMLDTIEAVYS